MTNWYEVVDDELEHLDDVEVEMSAVKTVPMVIEWKGRTARYAARYGAYIVDKAQFSQNSWRGVI